jgi:hypothetical protein
MVETGRAVEQNGGQLHLFRMEDVKNLKSVVDQENNHEVPAVYHDLPADDHIHLEKYHMINPKNMALKQA